MADNYVGEIRIFAGNFPPRGWAFCNGQLLPISQNTALFSLLGTNYGGDGKTNFALPNLQGAIPVHAGGGGAPGGLTPRAVGQSGGASAVTLTASQLPPHAHALEAAPGATSGSPDATVTLAPSSDGTAMYRAPDATVLNRTAAPAGAAGGGAPHDNLPPVLAMSFIIALQGIFPPRG
jgi:microcystin-dependent protein